MIAEERLPFGGDGPLALCLSGGGFRATLFHLGVIRLLWEFGGLSRVSDVFSVSGGSIMAAHLALNWAKYQERSPNTFQDLSDDLIRFVHRDIRGRIIRRWLLGCRRRAPSLQREYNSFFNRARLDELPRSPSFHFLCTSMTTGRLCAFTREHFVVVRKDGSLGRYPAEAQPVAQAVAASSAFPPLFPPLQLVLPDLPREEFPSAEYLTDGGVFDNLGLSQLHRLVSEQTKAGFIRILVSDASARFDHAPNTQFALLHSRVARATDILMQRVAALEAEAWSHEPLDRLTVLRISDTVEEVILGDTWFRPLSGKAQRLLRGVRTDFDAFPDPLIRALVGHGYEVAQLAALSSLLSVAIDQYRAVMPPPSESMTVVRPWDPLPPGWPDRKTMQIVEQASAMQAMLRRVQESLSRAHRDATGTAIPAVEAAKHTSASDERLALEQLEESLSEASERPIGLRTLLVFVFYGCVALAVVALAVWRMLPPSRSVPVGHLPLATIERFSGESWVATFPSLSELATNGHVYVFTTAPLGVLTDGRDHAPAIASVQFAADLVRPRVHTFLGRSWSEAPQVVALQDTRTGTGQVRVAAGDPRDRIVGILVTDQVIPEQARGSAVTITLEKAP